jgi:hypothetical protein
MYVESIPLQAQRSITMTDIKVNKLVWDSISELDKEGIVAHLRQYGVLKPGQIIVADAHTPLPSIKPHSKEALMGQAGERNVKALGVDWICRAICDSTNAETDCPLYGQSLGACLATVSASREVSQSDQTAEFS